ncbi:hypothetical protein D3C83_123020 [compost metagenome]
MVTRGQADQDRCVVSASRDDHQLGPIDVHRSKRRVAGRIALQHGAAERLRLLESLVAGVDDYDILRFLT